jgi:hypothetical protein
MMAMKAKLKFDKWEIDVQEGTKTRRAEANLKLNSGGHHGSMRVDTLIEILKKFPAGCEVTALEEDGEGILNLYLEESVPLTPTELAYEHEQEEKRIESGKRFHTMYENMRERSLAARALALEEER